MCGGADGLGGGVFRSDIFGSDRRDVLSDDVQRYIYHLRNPPSGAHNECCPVQRSLRK